MDQSTCISIQSVDKSFGKMKVLDSIDLSVQTSEIFGLLGPSGAGKTTLVRMIAGIDTPSSGRVTVLNTPMPDLTIMQRIGFMAQSDALYTELTARENLDFFAGIYGLRGSKKAERIKRVMEIVNLSEEMNKVVRNYSGGMKRRLSLAISLLHEPEILVLDEPTVGIDPILRQSIWAELEKLSSQGVTILVTTHVMDEADKCHRLAMMRDGKIIAVGSPNDMKEETQSSSLEAAFLTYGGAVR